MTVWHLILHDNRWQVFLREAHHGGSGVHVTGSMHAGGSGEVHWSAAASLAPVLAPLDATVLEPDLDLDLVQVQFASQITPFLT